MANSTYLNTVNRILQHAGEQIIADAATFNDNTLLIKPQLQAKLYVDKAQRRLVRTSRPRLALRQYSLSVTSASNSYALNTATSLENLREDSFFITTTAYASGPLKYITYEQWLEMYPAGETVKGIPRFWFDYVPDGTGDKVGFSPPSNYTMTIKYEGFNDPVALSAATDTIAFEPKYEDILWEYGQFWLEVSKGEGKAQDYAQVLTGLFEEYKQLTIGPTDRVPKVKLGMKLRGIRRYSTGKHVPSED